MRKNALAAALPVAALLITVALPAQKVHIVDITGKTGKFTSINKAIAAAANGDSIYVRKGTYHEFIRLHGKAVNIVGIAASPRDVVIDGAQIPGHVQNCFEIARHPANRVSRFARFRIVGDNHRRAMWVLDCKGDLLFDQIECQHTFDLLRHEGTASLTQVRVRQGSMLLSANDVSNIFLHDCDLVPSGASSRSFNWQPPCVMFTSCHAEVDHCRIVGPQGFYFRHHADPGAPAIEFTHSTGRITGLASDTIVGGKGHVTGHLSAGGPGVRLYGSTVVWSGVTIRGGVGTPNGPAHLGTHGSSFAQQSPAAPVVTLPRSYARNQVTTTTIHASPGALSLTFLALEWKPFRTQIGTYMVDPSAALTRGVYKHDSSGKATFALDLRGLPASFVSSGFVVQTFSLTNNVLGVSTPRFGIIGY